MDRPAIVATVDDLDTIDEPPAGADYLEIRLDRIAAEPTAVIDRRWPRPLILTNRPTTTSDGTDATDRLAVLADLADADDIWAIDIDLDAIEGAEAAAAQRAIEAARAADVSLICSSHRPSVPAVGTLCDILDAAASHGDIAKLAVAADTPDGLARLVEAASISHERGLTIAPMATGPYALASRVAAIGLEAALVYGVPPGADPVVPGQPSTAVLRSIAQAR